MEKIRPQAGRLGELSALTLLAFAAGLGVLLWLIAHAGLAPLKSAVMTIGVTGLLTVAVAHLPVIAILGLAWRRSARLLPRPAAMRFIWARALRDAGSEVLPFSQFGGLAMGARALSLFAVSGPKAFASTVIDLLIELATKLPYVLFGLGLLLLRNGPVGGGLSIAASAALAVVLVGANSLGLVHFLPGRGAPILIRKLGIVLRRYGPGPRDRRFAMALHLTGWFAGAAETWLIFWLLQSRVAPAPALIIDSLVGAIKMVGFFVPGAIGVQEGAYVLLCGLFGVSPAEALAFSLIRRARDLVIAALVLLPWPWRELQRLRAPSNLML